MDNSPFKAQGSSKVQTYVPVNLKLVYDMIAGGEPFRLNNDNVDIIELVCRITEFKETQNTFSCNVVDDFGSIKGVIYRKGDGSNPRALRDYTFSLNGYAHIIGNLRKFADNVQIVIQSIENITSYETVHYVKSKVMWAFFIRKGALHVPTHPVAGSTPVLTDLSKKIQQEENTNSGFSMLSKEQRQVMNAITSISSHSNGATIYSIAGNVGKTVVDLEKVLNELTNFGFIFTDDDGRSFHAS